MAPASEALVGGPFPHAHQLAQPWCGAAKGAQIAGVPVITANQGGMKELVREGIVGLYFQLGDPQNLRRVLLDVIEDPSQLQAMRLKAPEVPTIEAHAGIVTQLYVQAITTRPPVA